MTQPDFGEAATSQPPDRAGLATMLGRRLLILLAVGAVTGALVPMAGAQVNDPIGDFLTEGAAVDLRSLSAALDDVELVIRLGFATPPPRLGVGLFGMVELETAQGSSHELPAVDFLSPFHSGLSSDLHLDLGSYDARTGELDLRDDQNGTLVARVPVAVAGSEVSIRVPREWVGDAAHVTAAVGGPSEPSDVAPNGGFVTTVDAASEPAAVLLNDDRFAVIVEWRTAQGQSGVANLATRSEDSAILWFFAPDNWELLVKLLDGCGVNSHYWLLAAATTNVEVRLRVTDTVTQTVREYVNPLGQVAAPIIDVEAFATCP